MSILNYLLAIESSCDDTSVAIIDFNYKIVHQVTSSQVEHNRFGGVLPELASRLHIKNIMYLTELLIRESKINLNDIKAIAVSINPGLIGSLIVGLSFAKSFAWSLGIPLITVNHMMGHVFANYIEHRITPPFLALVVSGGHTELVFFNDENTFVTVGKTLDDSAGETFDKSAKLLNLGYPGGPVIDKYAKDGNPEFVKFPRALKQKDDYNFSYSGLKTAIKLYCHDKDSAFLEAHKSDLAASIQMAIIEPLISKTVRYAKVNNINKILLAGGVAANSLLKKLLQEKAASINAELYYPSLSLCTDNAAMIAAAAIPKYIAGQFSPLSVNAFSEKGIRFI